LLWGPPREAAQTNNLQVAGKEESYMGPVNPPRIFQFVNFMKIRSGDLVILVISVILVIFPIEDPISKIVTFT
jgi:hypothetical protein